MRRLLCQLVPACSLLLGCFGIHGTDGSPDANVREEEDAAPPATDGGDAPILDGGSPRPDGHRPMPDAGPHCSPREATLSCFSHVTAGRTQTVAIAMGGEDECYCGEGVACHAARGSEPRTLELTTSQCAGPFLCSGCFQFIEGTCELPPLEEGSWRVNVNGEYAYDLDVLPSGVTPERGETCVRSAARDESCGGVEPEPAGDRHGIVCHDDGVTPGTRVPLRVTDGCGGCGALAGPCTVDVFDDVIRVRPSTVFSRCDYACPAVCEPREDICWTPPLEAGTWRVVVDGIEGYESTLEVGTEPAEPSTVCGPIVPHDD